MQSINFEFLRPTWPELASLGGFAEAYAHGDPIGALVKLRAYAEQLATLTAVNNETGDQTTTFR